MSLSKVNMFIINGSGRSGKDSFVEFCTDAMDFKGYVYSISTVDFIKEIAKEAGWDEQKDETSRKYLSDLKDIFTQWLDTPYKNVEKKVSLLELMIEQYNLSVPVFLFVHCREPKEIERLKKSFGAKTILLRRDSIEQIKSNHADAEVYQYDYDYLIENNGSLNELEEKAKIFMEAFLSKTNCPYCGRPLEQGLHCSNCNKDIVNLEF